MKKFSAFAITLALGLGTVPVALAQASQPSKADQSATQDIKDAGHATGRAAKKTEKKVENGAKKGAHKTAEESEKAAGKVRKKTE